MRENGILLGELVTSVKKERILKRHVILSQGHIACESISNIKRSRWGLIVHQWVLKVNTISDKVTCNSELGVLES
jgi:hypothetical protein